MRQKIKPHLRQPIFDAIQSKKTQRFNEEPDDYLAKPPTWQFQIADHDGPWSCKNISAQDWQQICRRLASFEQSTWKQIEQQSSCGKIEVSDCCTTVADRLTEIGRDDYSVLYKLRICTKARLWGVRIGNVFKILWWDPEHTVYPMNIANN